MKKTFSPFSEPRKKFFYYLTASALLLISVIFSGCGGSGAEDPAVIRARDSLTLYSQIDIAFKEYKSALEYNKDEKFEKSKASFEEALKALKKVNSRVLEDSNNVKWKDDYANLAKSITQDYLYTQKDIPSGSLAFKFASKYNIKYEEIKLQYDSNEDLEPLPDGSDVPLVRNSAVDEYIEFFSKTDRGKNFIDKTMYRSGKYFPIMRKILRFHKAPEEMIYLSVQESGLNPTIVSKAGAVGLWQFMPATGHSYGLNQDSYRDDRRDFEKATDAAARHLKDLYRSFGDWYLAWAAYNAGPGRINGAINKSGSKDFWTIRSYLPGETKNYVPSILALSFIYRNPGDFGFKDIELGKPITFDRVNIKGELSFLKIAEFCNTDIETIRELNTELTQDVVPNYDVPYQLRIPHDSYKTFSRNYKNSEEFMKNGSNEPEFEGNENASYNTKEVAVKSYTIADYDPGDPKNAGLSSNKKYLAYTYRGHEKLSHVADSFGVRVSDIKMWNNIAWGANPKKNQILGIYMTEKQYNKFYGIKDEDKKEEVNKEEKEGDGEVTVRNDYGKKDKNTGDKKVKEKEKKNGSEVKTTDTDKKEKSDNKTDKKEQGTDKKTTDKKTTDKKTPAGTKQTYVVKEGDYLGSIAEAYGVTVSDLREWNEIEGDKILSGQKLVIYSDKKPNEKKNEKKGTVHTVEEGENLTGIAEEYGVTVGELKEWNELGNDVIYTGQKLNIAEPKKVSTKEKTKTDKKALTHTVKEGENLSGISDEYGVTVGELKEWNELENDVIYSGQKLNIAEPKKVSTKEKTKTDKKAVTHTVKEGENLTMIAGKYGVTVEELKDWNEIESDVIRPGQTLVVQKGSGKKNGKPETEEEPKSTKKTHKVKKGETLASISEEYGVSIKNLKQWNDIDADGTIYIGQVLKLYVEAEKKTEKKTTDTKKKRKRKSDYQ
jgi:membrane-bound lytic murein transglycosylase D